MEGLDKILLELTPQIIYWRRHIHANPELGYEEYKTSQFISKTLQQEGIKQLRQYASTGVVADIQGKGSKTIALRADMDALPIIEETGMTYASQNHGVMHACGHDAHMAIVLGVAAVLRRLGNLPGNVKIIFQPCEERLPGGAKSMISEGVLDNPKVDAMLGLHVYPYLNVGTLGVKPGAMMAATDMFNVQIIGRGGHGAAPHTTVDPIVIAANIITSLQTIVSRRINPVEPAVVTVGTIHAGERPNIIPQKATFSGTVRSISPETRAQLQKEITKLITVTAEAAGAKAIIEYEQGHGPLINDKRLTDFVLSNCKSSLGEKAVTLLEAPSMGGEDFAAFAEIIPATYIFFGCAGDVVNPWHHPCFNINENVMPFAVRALTLLIMQYLTNEGI